MLTHNTCASELPLSGEGEDRESSRQPSRVSGSASGLINTVAGGQYADELPLIRVLVVDEDAALRGTCCEIVRSLGFEPVAAADLPDARAALRSRTADLLLIDLKLPGGDGLELLQEVKESHPETGVIVMTAFGSISSAVEVMRIGARDYLTKPFALEELATVLERAARRVHFDLQSRKLRDRLRTHKGMGNLIGRSPAMEKVYRILSKVAYASHPVLILGESGTGKELVARSIHANGPDAACPFISMDCGAIPPALMEIELFGYVKGAFPGAIRAKEGLLTAARGGTVFLDEIGDLPLELQGKLLRALQEKEVRPLGAAQPVGIDARILAATNRDLSAMVTAGTFRRDLFFRLNVVNIKIPPLRERREDIRLLAEFFLERFAAQTGVSHSFSAEAIRAMAQYDWPGNVRELEHAVERVCALTSGPVLHMADLPTQLQDFRMHAEAHTQVDLAEQKPGRILPIADMERHAILETIRQLNGDKLTAARLLGIGKTTLYRKLKEYGIPDETGRD